MVAKTRPEIAEGGEINRLTDRIIASAVDTHRHLGPGLLESAYEECLGYELSRAAIRFARQVPLPIQYKGLKLDCSYRLDLPTGRRRDRRDQVGRRFVANPLRPTPDVFEGCEQTNRPSNQLQRTHAQKRSKKAGEPLHPPRAEATNLCFLRVRPQGRECYREPEAPLMLQHFLDPATLARISASSAFDSGEEDAPEFLPSSPRLRGSAVNRRPR